MPEMMAQATIAHEWLHTESVLGGYMLPDLPR